MDILNKIKKAGLVGRGGACFPTADKWEMEGHYNRSARFWEFIVTKK